MGVKGPAARSCITQIQPYQPGKPVAEVERELGIRQAVKLASNENVFGPSPRVRTALRKAVNQVHIYPDGACYYLRAALARDLGCRPDELILGNGSNELLVLLGMVYLNAGDEVLSSQMSFVVYSMVADLLGAKFIAPPMRDFTYDLETMAGFITSKTKLIFIANPNNPTGTLIEKQALRRFIDRVPTHCLVVLDEAYYEYVQRPLAGNTLDWVRERNNLVVLRTFSKAFALAGLRVGYGMAPAKVRENIERVRDPFNVNSLAQVAALAALADKAYMRKCVAYTQTERKRLSKELLKLGLKVIPSQTNFLFVKFPRTEGVQVGQSLLQQGIIVRPFPGSYVRITMGKIAENNKMLKAIKNIL
ncbi:histidinol-phosphate transaminase [bacterium]|nr:histidinol-phosphate transaminase [bacterium]